MKRTFAERFPVWACVILGISGPPGMLFCAVHYMGVEYRDVLELRVSEIVVTAPEVEIAITETAEEILP